MSGRTKTILQLSSMIILVSIITSIMIMASGYSNIADQQQILADQIKNTKCK